MQTEIFVSLKKILQEVYNITLNTHSHFVLHKKKIKQQVLCHMLVS